MRNKSLSPLKQAFAAWGAFALATASMTAFGPGGVAWAAGKTSRATAPAQPRGPAASGEIAYISGDTLEVRNPETGQTTVRVSAKTSITATVTVTLKAVEKGSCITASGVKAKDGALDATTVTLIAVRGGRCGGGLRVGARSETGNFPSRTARSGTPRRHFTPPANAATAFGKVIAVGGSKVTVEGTMVSFSALDRSSSTSKKTISKTVPKAKELAVEVSSKTRFLKTAIASRESLKVGECATAFGSTNNIGAVSATRLSVSPATSTGCGFGGGFFGPGGFGGATQGARG